MLPSWRSQQSCFLKTQNKMADKIRIANPVPGEARYTSIKKAAMYLRMNIARINENDELFFLNNHRVERFRRDADAAVQESAIRQYRGDFVGWRGTGDARDYRRPGECRS